MKNIKKFNESWFSKKDKTKETSDITPRGVSRTSMPDQRNTSSGLSEEELEELKRNRISNQETRVDAYFMQEISDRLFGPDSEGYMQAIKELNLKFRPREGRTANQFYDPSISGERRRKEDEINRNILKGE
jgi:hypothetical protein